MLQDVIYQNYGIVMERQNVNGAYQRFFSANVLYTIIPIQEYEEEELMERLIMAEYMQQQGDKYVSSFVMSNEQTYLSEMDDHLFILMANDVLDKPRAINMGYKLAKFHNRGRTLDVPIKACNRIGKWKELWENRLDYLEGIWREKMTSHPINEFEKKFVESFPYFSIMGENAIQYLVDCEIDDQPDGFDAGTISHDRFYDDKWLGDYLVKNPFEWVYDHHSRDIGEWVRQHYHTYPQTYQPTMTQFLQEYVSMQPLSSFSWRLLYSRLLFPVHYLEVIEGYYSSNSQGEKKMLEEKLEEILNQSHRYEDFLRYFYEINQVPINALQVPKVDWLS
ncbi:MULTISPECIES: spore coat putative kinase YutH [Bacillus]|uniref:spore coat putative kinase YutH n=1 Tax=Bacillus TaxID=1386 RepID=UPI0002EF76A6|nr:MULTISPECIES: spore coat protein YutH [Bacillus]